MKKFLVILIGITILSGIILLVAQPLNWFLVHPYAWHLLGFHALLAFISFFIMSNGTKGDGLDFSNHLMGVSTIRLLSSAVVLFLYFYFVRNDVFNFTITFFVFYVLFTGFELIAILNKPQTKS
jgi:hypothetical protein